MLTIRVAAFIIALVLAVGAIEPGQGWLVALAVLTGISALGLGGFAPRVYVGRRERRWVDQW